MGLGLEGATPPVHFSICERYRLDDPAAVANLDAEIQRTAAQLVVLGPLAQLADIRDENKAGEFNAVCRTLLDLARRHHALFVLAHHRRKEDQRAGPPRHVRAFFDSARGSNALGANLDGGIGLIRDPEESDGMLFVMRREGTSSRTPVSLDWETLTFWPNTSSNKASERPTLEEVERVVLAQSAPVGRSLVATEVRCSPTTARNRLDRLVDAGRLSRSGGPREVVLYGPPAPVPRS